MTYDEITLEDGTEARQYASDPSGALRNAKGQMLTRHPDGAPLITPDTAHAMLKQRKLKRLEAAERGMMLHPDFDTPDDALEAMMATRVQLACTAEAGHASNQAHKLAVDEYSGSDRASAPAVAIQVNISDDIAARYLGDDVVVDGCDNK